MVRVAGAVREPGLYPLIGDGAGGRYNSFGGYTDTAYLERVEVRRISISETQEAQVEILNINLAQAADTDFRLVGQDTLEST